MSDLPIYAVLPDLLSALDRDGAAVLIAPPGAGKTTAVAPALLDQAWCTGQIILLSPRRVAARAAAERMAEMLGEKAGETVGYLTRLDSKQSARTRILVMTEAIFVNRIVEDAELQGVSAVLFDEAHERHLDSDLGLALALESRAVLRDDLRICVMSATIDGERFAALLGPEASVIESEGKAHPLRIEWLGSRAELSIEDRMTQAVLAAWRQEDGDVLAFLPGVREIERVRERLTTKLPDVPVLPLHGQIDPAGQRAAIQRNRDGFRRIVLATAIAETSLTLHGVSVVVDSGLARRAEFDRAAGTTHLVTVRASQAAAAQRAGRAARLGPGVAFRMWEEAGHAGRPKFDPPEVETSDLAPLMLALAKWGTQDPASLAWIDPPPAASIASARERLRKLGALDAVNAITPFGNQVASLPMDPVSAAMILYGAQVSRAEQAARLALLLQERGLGGRSEDLLQRLDRWNSDTSPRAKASRKLAARWTERAERLISGAEFEPINPALFLAFAKPDNIAKRRDASGENWASAGGRGYFLDPASPLGSAEWLVIADAQGQAKGARITAAARLDPSEVEAHLGHVIERRSTLRWNTKDERAEARKVRKLGEITISTGPDPEPNPAAMQDLLLDTALDRIDAILPAELVARARFIGLESFQEQLVENAGLWLAPLLVGRRDLKLPKSKLVDAILGQMAWNDRQKLDTLAPRAFATPANTHHTIDYVGEGAPSVDVRVQALFGLDQHPMIGYEPLLLNLTSPAGRPIQATRDLPGFWRGSWQDVCKDMKGRYPKHRWPEHPWLEKPSLKTKNAFSRGQS
ncbi:ATP-dependent helicase HrpB [Pontixanthobacter aestiaquae]|uniref:ATP-dependent helicase HrpB n=1 Tax=Pontixanthobacter aestiaquae TaxID=1509367 RepID=A0A844Z5R6_9SPHN|nr:ATP-dependent helicase HrpB [Pontixanthobacter aestiaquae]MDN3645740.1 ATP-dependent helicase HrpB [Pontixanthobacter aestiaquae]MXO83265.1 ATP-dependent helicase HrpB [Pontixanthobacter aestiaquae]